MIIGIDGSLAGNDKTGMGVMVDRVVRELSAMNLRSTKIIVYKKRFNYPRATDSDQLTNIVFKPLPFPTYPVWEQIVIPAALRRDQVDVFWAPYNTSPLWTNTKTVLTVHDTIFMEDTWLSPPTWKKRIGKLYRRTITPHAIDRASSVLTVSNHSKKDILSSFPDSAGKISVAHLGVGTKNPPVDETRWSAVKSKYDIDNRFILAQGSSEPRKNCLRVLQAYTEYCRQNNDDIQLVMFGFRNFENSPSARWLERRPELNVVILDYIEDDIKEALFEKARIFVFPSLAEGFGLPVLEAMHAGTPTVTSNTTATQEVAGNATVSADPQSVASITTAIQSLLGDPLMEQKITQAGLHNASRFNWTKTAESILSKLREAHTNNRQRER